MNPPTRDQRIENKMHAAGVARPTIQAFLGAVRQVAAGERGLLPESTVEPVPSLPLLNDLPPESAFDSALLRQLVVIKLNGGLGTSMGLERAKSLMRVKGPDTFLDFIARQVLDLRGGHREPAFYLMNSFGTQQDTLDHLSRYPELAGGEPIDFLQSRVPKVDATTLDPVAWPPQPELEWCPPGHGDLYPSLLGTGLLESLRTRGIRYAFVSNADNLGATVDLRLLRYFVEARLSFLMEVAERTAADRKGGHLARRRAGGRLLLRESAQTPREDEASFQDIQRHRYFNTNNLWVQLEDLQAELDRQGGALPLPLITNTKTVDPKDARTPKVLQLESAMGAAIECFERSGAVVVPRDRFAPVKTTADLLAVRSDAYVVTSDHRLVLDPARGGQPPLVTLDAAHYRVMTDFETYLGQTPPSLIRCRSIQVSGPLRFAPGVVCRGTVEFHNQSSQPKTVPAGIYEDSTRQF